MKYIHYIQGLVHCLVDMGLGVNYVMQYEIVWWMVYINVPMFHVG